MRLCVLSRTVGAIGPGIGRLCVWNNSEIVGRPAWISDIQYALAPSLQLSDLARQFRLSFGNWLKLYLNFRH